MSKPVDVRVVHRDEHLLVLQKPTGLQTTSPDEAPSLVDVAKKLDPGARFLHATSRLDADVTGLVIFARSQAANAELLWARKEGLYERAYVAITAALAGPERGEWTASIAVDTRDPRKRRAVEDDELDGAKRSRTLFQSLAQTASARAYVFFPKTGRTHQLRVHAAHAQMPLLGDVHYGGARRVALSSGRMVSARRVMLHCAIVRVPPMLGQPSRVFSIAPADDMLAAWAELGGDVQALTPASQWFDLARAIETTLTTSP